MTVTEGWISFIDATIRPASRALRTLGDRRHGDSSFLVNDWTETAVYHGGREDHAHVSTEPRRWAGVDTLYWARADL